MLNEYDCPLLELSKRIFTTSCHSIQSSVSVVRECSTSCVVQEGSSAESMEREVMSLMDWSSLMIGQTEFIQCVLCLI